MSRRTDRINEQLREEISTLLARQINDPRLNRVVSITRVITSSDLRSARVYISVMGREETRQAALEGIRSAASFLRHELRNRINMRHTSFLTYELDSSLEEADQVLRVMDQIRTDEPVATGDRRRRREVHQRRRIETAPATCRIDRLGTIDSPKRPDCRRLVPRHPRAQEPGHRNRRDDPDDGHDDKEFDQRETLVVLHRFFLRFLATL